MRNLRGVDGLLADLPHSRPRTQKWALYILEFETENNAISKIILVPKILILLLRAPDQAPPPKSTISTRTPDNSRKALIRIRTDFGKKIESAI